MNWRPPLVAIGLLLFSAVPSRADIILVPYLGQSWSGIINDAGGGYPTTYGVRAEWLMGIFGLGLDAAHTPDFLRESVRDSTLSTLMANVVVGGRLPEERGFRPYLTAGAGVLLYDLTALDGRGDSATDFGYNLGAGASVLFTRHIGAEIDFRYFRNTKDFRLGGLDFPEEIVEYARWSGGVIFRF